MQKQSRKSKNTLASKLRLTTTAGVGFSMKTRSVPSSLMAHAMLTKGDITCMRIRRAGDEDDPYTDYCAGYFVDNVTQLIHACKPPEPKYKPGQLVRGKETKRAKRWGFAGKVGLVTDSGSGQARVLWNGEEPTRSYFSERDLELVSG